MAIQVIRYFRIINKPSAHHHYHLLQSSKITTRCSSKQVAKRYLSTCSSLAGSAGRAETTSTTQGLSKLQAQELVLRLNGEERNILISALQEFQSKLVRAEYEGKY